MNTTRKQYSAPACTEVGALVARTLGSNETIVPEPNGTTERPFLPM
jgi:hypothetical protein